MCLTLVDKHVYITYSGSKHATKLSLNCACLHVGPNLYIGTATVTVHDIVAEIKYT